MVMGIAAQGRRLVVLLATLAMGAVHAGTEATSVRTITDATGRTVVIPARVERIGCLTGASFEKAALVGAADKVVVRQATFPPWMAQVFPRVATVPTIQDSRNPNIEELLRLKLDALFFWDDPEKAARLAGYGIAVVFPQPEHQPVSSADAFLTRFKAEVDVYGRVLGGPAVDLARSWSDYVDRRVRYVRERLARLRPEQRPRTYYLRGPDALTTQGADQSISWLGELAGADMVVRHDEVKGIARISMEQVLVWNPEVIFVGRQYSPELVLKDPRWQRVAAVRNGRVYAVPDGVFFWDSSSEGILLLQFLAGKLHPELFPDLDLGKEVRDYYARFYRYRLNGRELDLLLAGQGPDGQRRNGMNN
ncbi:MAG TPA: ABC transporter substrate-binding protein [Rhodocyclaceae bacterium]|jgi:iron complex transport system substrate-binding protein|nr:ABC transporter substrate-binding protein [Rhodocyclaceae bacterium]